MPTLTRADAASIDDLLSVDDKEIKTIIDESIEMNGDLVSNAADKAIVVAGKFTGTIRSAGKVVILGSGLVKGSIRAPLVVLGGEISRRSDDDGVVVDGPLVLASSARLMNNAVYESLHSDHGAMLAGMVVPRDSSFFADLHQAGRLAFVDSLKPVDAVGKSSSSHGARAQVVQLVDPPQAPLGDAALADHDHLQLGTGTGG